MTVATPFHKLLIANRGEIALRVMRSARALGLRTVAVHSSAEARARHVLQADQALCIGAPAPSESYLNIDAIIEAARRSGADAVHPGYGFLAENEAFAAACRAAGLVFVGPSPAAIRAMGDKAGAKALMQRAGVPCIPGWQGDDQSDARLAREAAALGWPLMIKATAGGGGRGMRLVQREADFMAALHSARSEAQGAFGNATVLLEKAITEPRHIEIQVFADRHGQAIHLGERDCSVQRRHQKLIEEAPSPAVSAELRERMGAVAVGAVRAIGYEGAGTLEFLLDSAGQFYFMEMNTRLQVEHAVTEAITGLDLVVWQLRVAAGEPLPLAQHQVGWQGHAIEARLCAEDAQRDFMPQSGHMLQWQMPGQVTGQVSGLRVDDALQPGMHPAGVNPVLPFYDSMIAKIVAHGATRDEARRKLVVALQDAVALGVVTNQAFLARTLAHPVFAAGRATTAFIAQQGADLFAAASPAQRQQAAAVAAVLLNLGAAADAAEGAHRGGHRLPVLLRLALEGEVLQGQLVQQGDSRWQVRFGSAPPLQCELTHRAAGGASARLAIDGLAETAHWQHDDETLLLHWSGRAWRVQDLGRTASVSGAAAQSDGRLRASTSGRVVAVQVQVGDAVQAGQALVTLEAMKMEHVHSAPLSGQVRAVHVAQGAQVAARSVMVEIDVAA